MSVCRDCCNEIYSEYFKIHGTLEKSIYCTCEDLDVKFDEEAVKYCQSHLTKTMSTNKSSDKVFGIYKSKLSSLTTENEGLMYFRFRDSETNKSNNSNNDLEINEDISLSKFWGKTFTKSDIDFLEYQLENWKATHKCETHAELLVLKEICILQLEIERLRESGKPTGTATKELIGLMKAGNYDPANANVASSGKSHESFGLWVKDIEQKRPAEWFEDQEKYKDIDGFSKYIDKYIKRPIENFLMERRFFADVDEENLNGGEKT
jgi:hypothetical protein